jgi:putative toxin-antitoxin system antitoxin component (TIGR02293 family)
MAKPQDRSSTPYKQRTAARPAAQVRDSAAPGLYVLNTTDDLLDAHRRVSKGVSNRRLGVLVKHLRQPLTDVAAYLGVSPATMRRYMAKPSAMLPIAVGARVATIDRLWSHALRTFGGDEAARDWLGTEQPALDYAIPAELLTTEQGCAAVEEVLGRIEHGVFT